MRIIITESQLSKIIQEQEGSDPKNPDSYPDQDVKGIDDAWTWDEWKIYYDSLKKKYGESFAKKRFLKYWEVVEEGIGVLADNDMEPQWFMDKNMWNEEENRPYSLSEYLGNTTKGEKVDGTGLRVSQKFWDHIKQEEGSAKDKSKPMLRAYKDSAGVTTIGWGHTDGVNMGDSISNQQALDYLYKDAKIAADCVRRLLERWKSENKKTKKGEPSWLITQGQFDALVSIAFNAGCNGLLTSDLIQKVKTGEHEKVVELIKRFKITAGKGLSSRREIEAKLYQN